MRYHKEENQTYLIVYTLVWCVKRKKEILSGEIGMECQKLIIDECEKNRWEIISLDIYRNYIRLVVSVFPSVPAANVIKKCKDVTAGNLRDRFPVLRKLPSLWTSKFFASTEEKVKDEVINRFLDVQSNR